jgi:hypothetical protein
MMMMMMAPAPPNDTGDNQTTSDETAGNEKVMANEGSRSLLRRGFPDGVKPVIHAPRQIKDRSSLPTRRLLLHHPKT